MSTYPPCTTDVNGCITCSAVPSTPAVPATYTDSPVVGWNAGANSILVLDGDLYTTFGLPTRVTGIVLGFKSVRTFQSEPTLVQFGLYLSNIGGNQYVNVSEYGVQLTAPLLCAATDSFTIRRIAGVITYLRNSTILYTSLVPSAGPLLVNACLYSSGDEIL